MLLLELEEEWETRRFRWVTPFYRLRPKYEKQVSRRKELNDEKRQRRI